MKVLKIVKSVYWGLCWVSVAARGFVASRASSRVEVHRYFHCGRFSCWGPWALEHTGFRSCGSWFIEHRLSSCETWT